MMAGNRQKANEGFYERRRDLPADLHRIKTYSWLKSPIDDDYKLAGLPFEEKRDILPLTLGAEWREHKATEGSGGISVGGSQTEVRRMTTSGKNCRAEGKT